MSTDTMIPITGPLESKTGLPLLPGETGADICCNLYPRPVLRSPLNNPSEIVFSNPTGLPIT